MEVRILFIDDESIRDDLVEYFNDYKIGDYVIKATSADTFDEGLERIKRESFEIIVLDLCKGKASEDAEQEGLSTLKSIQQFTFVPVIFHSGLSHKIDSYKSLIVGVTDKRDGQDGLVKEITRILKSNTIFLKNNIHQIIDAELIRYFWEVIHGKRNLFKPDLTDSSLGYLMLRRLANSLSKENIKYLIGEERISEKVHPMEYYIYPVTNNEFETGEVLLKDGKYFVILTPSCDFIEDKANKRERRAGKVLLAETVLLTENEFYIDYLTNKSSKNKEKLQRLIESRKGDQYFFLPGTPFIKNLLVDFQNKIMVDYSDLKGFERVALLDDPFVQSMISSFVRFYNRIGSPDLDSEVVLNNL
ncbi:MAG: hypothetical protein FGM41_07410 [Bacteroidetes bacterium]|nr:hypothetical protein [Bacteroidota bacterium]